VTRTGRKLAGKQPSPFHVSLEKLARDVHASGSTGVGLTFHGNKHFPRIPDSGRVGVAVEVGVEMGVEMVTEGTPFSCIDHVMTDSCMPPVSSDSLTPTVKHIKL
jgi:hypothetical protein